MKLLKYLIVLSLFIIIGCTSTSVKKNSSGSILVAESNKGKIVAINYKDLHYFLRIQSRNLQWQHPTDEAYLLKIDGNRILKLMNLQNEYLKKNKGKYTGKQVLMNYNSNELKYHVDKYGKDVKYTGKYFVFKKTPTIYWTLALPAGGGKPQEKYQFFSMFKNDANIITLGTVADRVNEESSKMELIKIIATLSTYPKEIRKKDLDTLVGIINKKK